MDSGLYAACTGLITRTQALDTIANNLANANTSGYRAERNNFSSVLADEGKKSAGTALNNAINDYGILGGTSLDYAQGALQKTGNNLDLAISGPGFFTVQTANGPMYTRNGSFRLSTKGQITTASGDPVMGDKGPISLLPGEASISPDGTVSQNGAVIAKLRIVDFPANTNITSAGLNYYSAPAASAAPAKDFALQQGVLEGSNVNPILSMVELVDAQRSAEMMQRALSMFNSEIDKTATQDLPKVG